MFRCSEFSLKNHLFDKCQNNPAGVNILCSLLDSAHSERAGHFKPPLSLEGTVHLRALRVTEMFREGLTALLAPVFTHQLYPQNQQTAHNKLNPRLQTSFLIMRQGGLTLSACWESASVSIFSASEPSESDKRENHQVTD